MQLILIVLGLLTLALPALADCPVNMQPGTYATDADGATVFAINGQAVPSNDPCLADYLAKGRSILPYTPKPPAVMLTPEQRSRGARKKP